MFGAARLIRSISAFPQNVWQFSRRHNLGPPLAAIPTTDEMTKMLIEHLGKTNVDCFNEDALATKHLASRMMADSYRQFRVPLSTDDTKSKLYLSASGNVRLGKLLEDLDHFAVHVCYAHNAVDTNMSCVGTLPRTIVTASVHRIDFHCENLNPARDIIIDGQVTWAGTSSLEVSMRVFQHDDSNNLALVLKARFFMVSRNPKDGNKKVRVHPLAASSPDEAAMINDALETMKQRNQAKLTASPTDEELRVIHNIYENRLHKDPHTNVPTLGNKEMWLHNTHMQMTDICFPENQNMYGKIFGGYLMRKAFELAHINAKLFCKGRVAVRTMDDIVFMKPVEIGDLLHLDSYITYTSKEFMQVHVKASVTDTKILEELALESRMPTLCEEHRKVTNVFHFTLESLESREVPTVLPKNYAHANKYVEGRRHLLNSLRRIGQRATFRSQPPA